MGRHFMWHDLHRNRGPREHNDPPGYQSRGAFGLKFAPCLGHRPRQADQL